MLRVHLTAEDLMRTKFASQPAPLVEVENALAAMRGQDAIFRSWRRAAVAGSPPAVRTLLGLVPAAPPGLSFLDPVTTGLAEGLELVQQASTALVLSELERVSPAGQPATWMRLLAARDRQTWRDLDQALRLAHQHLIRDDWPRIHSSFRAELAWRSRLIAESGVRVALETLHPTISWDGTVLQIRATTDVDFHLGGTGLTLLPSAFWTERPMLADHPDGSTALIYPALTPLPLIDHDASDPLAGLLGHTRAAVLRLSLVERTTTKLAGELGTSLATVSSHTKALRAAGLIVTTRAGKAVQHLATPLGNRLLDSCSPAPGPASDQLPDPGKGAGQHAAEHGCLTAPGGANRWRAGAGAPRLWDHRISLPGQPQAAPVKAALRSEFRGWRVSRPVPGCRTGTPCSTPAAGSAGGPGR